MMRHPGDAWLTKTTLRPRLCSFFLSQEQRTNDACVCLYALILLMFYYRLHAGGPSDDCAGDLSTKMGCLLGLSLASLRTGACAF